MKTAIKQIRIPFQIIALLLHTYYIFKTIDMFLNKTGEDAWFSMLFTLLIVIACEVVSFIDIILFVISKHNIYSYINLSLFIINVIFFMTVNYYYSVGTVIGLSLYAALYILRVVNLVLNFINICKKSQAFFCQHVSEKSTSATQMCFFATKFACGE